MAGSSHNERSTSTKRDQKKGEDAHANGHKRKSKSSGTVQVESRVTKDTLNNGYRGNEGDHLNKRCQSNGWLKSPTKATPRTDDHTKIKSRRNIF